MKKVQSLGRGLAALQPGERSWFWYCPDSPELPLLMERFSDPKGAARLLRRAGSLELPSGARVCTGISAVTDDGTIQFGSPSFEAWMLIKLSIWVHRNVAAVPELAYLSNAAFLQVSAAGAVTSRFTDPELWEGLEAPGRPGTLAHAAACMDALVAGEELWLWLAQREDVPLAVAVPLADDPDGEQLAAQVLAGRSRLGAANDPGLRGVARRLSSGSVLITTSNPLVLGGGLVEWLGARGEVRLVQLRDGEIVDGTRLGATGGRGRFDGQVAALKELAAGGPCAFWFTTGSKSGGPLLLLESSPAALKPLAVEAAGPGASLRGRLVAAPWGLEFRTKSAMPGFIAALAQWVEASCGAAPGLRALVGARMTVRDRAGEITERQRDDNAWAPMRDHRGE